VPQSADKPENNAPLPDPALNPLVNPVLGAHMGRWAEVYFTSPPERREQAILNLLHELESNPPAQTGAAQSSTAEAEHGRGLRMELVAEAAPVPEPFFRCPSCGAENFITQKFCGMCGSGLAAEAIRTPHEPRLAEPRLAATGLAELGLAELGSAQLRSAEPGASESSDDFAQEWYNSLVARDLAAREAIPVPRSFAAAASASASPSAGWPIEASSGSGLGSQSSFFHTPREEGPALSIPQTDVPDFCRLSDEPAPSRSRLYIGVVLALLLGVLGYAAWRRSAASSNVSSTGMQPASETSLPEMPPPSLAAPASSPQTSDDANASPAAVSTTASATPAENTAQNAQALNRSAAAGTSGAMSGNPEAAARSSAAAPTDNGAEELSIAQQYLSGTRGNARDSSEAAKWLWKAVGKQNAAATLALSDLYLRGDGVPRNCDQAHVLLQAAARRGQSSAAERLRNLPAFGCE
jgi:hypothetical protein